MWLVTGSKGFIGSALVSEWTKDGGRILTLDSEIENINIADLPWSQIDGVVHLGAISTTTYTDIESLLKFNVAYTWELFKQCTHRNIPFIFTSSASVYGNPTTPWPKTLYAASKKFSEDLITLAPKRPYHYYILRLFNVYGPNEHHKGDQRSMVSQAYGQLLLSDSVKLFDKRSFRDFVYVKDVVDCISHVAEHLPESGTYDLGTGSPSPFEELVELTSLAMGRRGYNIEYMDLPENLKYSFQTFTCANTMNRVPGWESKWSLKDGIDDYVKNYLAKGKTL